MSPIPSFSEWLKSNQSGEQSVPSFREWLEKEQTLEGEEQESLGGKTGTTFPATPKRKGPWSKEGLFEGLKQGVEKLTGIGEGALNVATGMTAFPVNVATGVAGAMPGATANTFVTPKYANEARNKVSEVLTYQPKTEGGKLVGEALSKPFELLTKGLAIPKEMFTEFLTQATHNPKLSESTAELLVDTALAGGLIHAPKLGAKAGARFKKETPTSVPDKVQRIHPPGEETLTSERQGIYTSPVIEGTESPYRKNLPKEYQNTKWDVNKQSKIKTIDKETEWISEIEKLVESGKTPAEAEKIMGDQFREQGYDAFYINNPKEPVYSEYIALTDRAFKPKIPSPEAPGTTISGGAATTLPGTGRTQEPPHPGSITSRGFIEMPGVEQRRPLTVAETKVMDQIAPKKTLGQKIGGGVKSLPQTLITEIFDKYDPIKKFERKVAENAGKNIPIEESAYYQAIGYSGHEGITWNAQQRLKQVIQPLGKNYHDWVEYMLAKRNIDRARKGMDNPGGVTLADAKQAITDMANVLPEAERTKVKTARQGFQKWNDEDFLKPLRDNGFIKEKEYQALKAQGEDFFPYDMAEYSGELLKKISPENFKTGDNYYTAVKDILFPQTGTTRLIKDPVETALKRQAFAVSMIEKNKVLRNLANMEEKSGGLIRKMAPGDPIPPNCGVFAPVINGSIIRFSAPRDVVKSLTNLSGQEAKLIDNLLGKSKQAFTALTTGYNLPFSIGNIPRDFKMAAITSKHPFNLKTWVSGFASAIPASFGFPTELAKQYYQSKAGFGGLIQRNLTSSVKQLRKSGVRIVFENIANPAKLIKNIAQTGEMAPRMGIFKEAIKRKETTEAAGLMARGSTIDFARSGAFTRQISKWVPFLNARAQAKLSLVEAFSNKSSLKGGKAHAAFGIYTSPKAAATTRAALWILVPALGTYFYNRVYHNDLYDQIPDDTKDRYHNLVLGEKTNPKTGQREIRVVPIPKGDVDGLVWNATEHFLDWAWKKEPQKLSEIAIQWLGELSPVEMERGGKISPEMMIGSVSPPFLRAGAEVVANKNLYWGNQIVPERLQAVEPKEQYKETTPEFYKKMGSLLNISPLMMQHAFRSGLGATTAAPSLTAQWEAVKGRVVRGISKESKGTQLNEYYETAKKGYYTARLRAMREMEKGNQAAALTLMKTWNNEAQKTMSDVSSLLGMKSGAIKNTPLYKMYTFQIGDWKRMKKSLTDHDKTFFEKKLGMEIK